MLGAITRNIPFENSVCSGYYPELVRAIHTFQMKYFSVLSPTTNNICFIISIITFYPSPLPTFLLISLHLACDVTKQCYVMLSVATSQNRISDITKYCIAGQRSWSINGGSAHRFKSSSGLKFNVRTKNSRLDSSTVHSISYVDWR